MKAKKLNHKLKCPYAGFKVSTNYKKLWKLIQCGNRVPAWIVYSDEYKRLIWDLVEVKLRYQSDKYSIGVRGVGYETFDSDYKSFEMNCKSLSLHFIK